MKVTLSKFALIAAVFALVGFGYSHQTKELCSGFLPENTMKIPVGRITPFGVRPTAAGGITEAQFNSVMDRVQKLYGPVVAQAGGTLQINRLWTDETVNASATEQGSTWILNMYGGLARHQEINIEGMALVACHEMGHHLGGAPKFSSWFNTWATNEGGADYFATLKCLRNYFLEDDNAAILKDAQIEPIAKMQCEKQFTNTNDQLICERISMAGESVAGLFMDLRKQTTRPKYDTTDKTEVDAMDDNHPDTQCRMDTYFAGAICHVDKSVANSATDYKQGTCVQGVDDVGYRPRCWFKPN